MREAEAGLVAVQKAGRAGEGAGGWVGTRWRWEAEKEGLGEEEVQKEDQNDRVG